MRFAAFAPTAIALALTIATTAAARERIVPVSHTADEWRALLPPESYHVLREAGTELAFTGKLWNEHRRGDYVCAGCGLLLFRSSAKFESGTGWPSFWQPAVAAHVVQAADHTLGMDRDELRCARCGGHLGHVFDDGPPPTGLRFCINSAALRFVPAR